MCCLRKVDDPRKPSNGTRHDFVEILVIAMAAALSECDTVEDIIACWAQKKEGWLGQFLPLKNGVASEKTFLRIFRALDPKPFEVAFRRWVAEVVEGLAGGIAVDGETVRGSGSGAAPFTWPVPSPRNWASSSARKRSPPRVMRSPPSRNCSRHCRSRACWSPLTPWGARGTSPLRSPTTAATTCSREKAINRRCWKPSRLILLINANQKPSTASARFISSVVGSSAKSPRSCPQKEPLVTVHAILPSCLWSPASC